jgi:hypothetical protein
MKRVFVLLSLVALSLTAWCQAPPNSISTSPSAPQKAKVSPLAEYAGEWTSTFDGKTWLSLRLELHGDQLSGWLLHPHSLELNDNGELKSVSEEQSTETITNAVLNPDGLLLTLKDPDTQEIDRYLMKLLPPEKATADLKMIAMSVPPGMPKPKPWRLVKAGVATTTKATAPR